jgi:hypothetical protein
MRGPTATLFEMAMATDTDGLAGRFAAIAAIDAKAAFGPFDAARLEHLRRYSRVCGQLNRREVLRRPIRFSFSAGPTGGGEALEHAGEEALRSAMVDFRLLWMDGEPTQFGRLRNLVRAHVDDSTEAGRDALEILDALGKDMSDARREIAFGGRDPSGVVHPTGRAVDVIEDWLYGVCFHQDEERAARVAAWSPQTYEFMLLRSVNNIANVCFAFAVLVDGILAAQG